MPSPSIPQLTAFTAVADFGGFSHAADELRMSQPAVSQQVRLLEQQVGVPLFERRPRGTVLTAAGEALLPHARSALRAVDALLIEAERQRGGLVRLRLGAIPTIAPYLLPQVIGVLRAAHPQMQLHVTEQRTADLLAALDGNQIDLAFIATPEDSELIATTIIGDDPFLLAVAAQDVFAASASVPTAALLEREVLLLQEGHCLRGQAQQVLTTAGRAATHDVSATSLSTVCQMVAAGQGVTLLPRLAVPVECREGSGIRAVPLADGAHGRTLRIAWRRTSPHAAEFASLADELRGALLR